MPVPYYSYNYDEYYVYIYVFYSIERAAFFCGAACLRCGVISFGRAEPSRAEPSRSRYREFAMAIGNRQSAMAIPDATAQQRARKSKLRVFMVSASDALLLRNRTKINRDAFLRLCRKGAPKIERAKIRIIRSSAEYTYTYTYIHVHVLYSGVATNLKLNYRIEYVE